MSSFAPDNALGNFIPENFSFENLDDQDSISILKRALEEHARTINRKDTGQYEEVEILCNQQFFGDTPQDKKFVYRKCFEIGAVGTGATLNIAHNISNIVEFTRIYGTGTTGTPIYLPLPYVSVTAANAGIELLVDATNVVIISGAAAPALTNAIIVLEYLKN